MKEAFKNFLKRLKLFFIPVAENNYQPTFLCCRVLAYLAVFLIVLKIIILPVLLYLPKTDFFAEISKFVLIKLTNEERIKRGLPPLTENFQLDEAAALKAQDMLTYDYFSHKSPQGLTPWYWFNKVGYKYNFAGENLGIGFLDSEEIYQAWQNSPSHYANLLNPAYEEIGLAVVRGNFKGNETVVVVQLFGSPQKKTTEKREIRTSSGEEGKEAGKSKLEEVAPLEQIKENKEASQPAEAASATPASAGVAGEKTGFAGATSGAVSGPENESGERASGEEKKNGFLFAAVKFLALNYIRFVDKFFFFLLILMFSYLLINIALSVKIGTQEIALRTFSFALLLLLFVLVNKDFLVRIIPHQLSI